MSERPELTPALTGDEFRRWYWLKDELIDFARSLQLRTAGSKAVLTDRIAAALDGLPFVEPTTTTRVAQQLAPPLDATTLIPHGQRCSQVVRAWFFEQVGPGFRFDAPMREYFAAADGTSTLGDALTHWHATRDRAGGAIGEQFEYNRFTRRWHEDNPDGDRAALLAAWREYRSVPADERP